MAKINKEKILSVLESLFPETHSFLNYTKDYELLFATILSAQATDNSVNKATEKLFVLYPSLEDYTEENREGIYECIKSLGLGKSKCEHLIKSAKILLEEYDGKVPLVREEIMKLPGAGYKTSGVVLGELYNYPYIPVDTHVQRVSLRLGLVNQKSTPEQTEKSLEKIFKENKGIHLHHQFILFGRNVCMAKNPNCENCPLKEECRYYKNEKRKASK